MAQQTINIGASPNDGTGTPLRTSFDYTNQNFTELYTAVGPSGNNIVVPGTATITGDLDVSGNGAFIGIGRVGLQRPFIPTGQNGTTTLDYRWYSTGTTYVTGARIRASSEAAWSSVSAPTRLMFETVPSGAVGLSERYRISGDGLHTWSNVNNVGGTQMTLDGTGLIVTGATITGDLTVRTNKLRVTSIGVGANTLTPAASLHSTATTSYDALTLDSDSASTYCTQNWKINGVQKAQAFLDYADDSLLIRTNTATGPLKFGCNNILQHRIDPLGVFNWYDGAGGTRMTLNSTGLGIGVVPSAWFSGWKVLQLAGGTFGGPSDRSFSLQNAIVNTSGQFQYIAAASTPASAYRQFAGAHDWYTAAAGTSPNQITDFSSAKMTLDASGNLLVGATTQTSNEMLRVNSVTSTGWAVAMTSVNRGWLNRQSDASGGIAALFEVGASNTNVGSITTTAVATAYNIASDYRLKESVQPLAGGLARISALKPSIYKWKVNGSNGEGFLAHELADVVPAAVTGEKDAVDADGKPTYQGVDLSKIVPILVAAIQELTAEVNALKNA